MRRMEWQKKTKMSRPQPPLHHPILPWREQSVPAAVTRGREVSLEPGGGVRFP